MYYRHDIPDPPHKNPEELLATFPKGLAFGLDDLWGLTKSLVRELPGVAVTRISPPPFDGGWLLALIEWNSKKLPNMMSENLGFEGATQDLNTLRQHAISAMGEPHEYGERRSWVHDKTPDLSEDPAEQTRIAGIFLRSMTELELQIPDPENQRRLITVSEDGKNTLASIWTQADINLHLARFSGLDLEPYEEILARAETWTPASVPSGMSWLA